MAVDPICGMQVNEKTGERLTLEGKIYYFCNPNCRKKFQAEHNIPETCGDSCAPAAARRWYANKVLVIALLLAGLCGLAYVIPVLVPFREALVAYARQIGWAVALGLVLGGIIDYFVPRSYISAILSRPGTRTIFSAVGLGFLLSACSHGILALAIQLYKKGASPAAVVAFLLASPWANMAMTIMLLGFFGLKALYIIGVALVIAVTTGLIFQFLGEKGWIETNPHAEAVAHDFSVLADLRQRLREAVINAQTVSRALRGIGEGTLALSNMVLWWILIGMGLASAASAYIPAHVFHTYMGPSVTGLLVTLALATVIEVCSEGSSPLAFGIYQQTGALGNSFVFLMAGVVTDYTEIGLLWQNVGRKTALWLPVITVPQVLFWGILANNLFGHR